MGSIVKSFCILTVSILFGLFALNAHAQDIEAQDVRISLDQALLRAEEAAVKEFPDLRDYILYSVHPRVLKNDPKGGLFWQVSWQERKFPHNKMIIVRIYMKDGRVAFERIRKGSQQPEW